MKRLITDRRKEKDRSSRKLRKKKFEKQNFHVIERELDSNFSLVILKVIK